MGANTPEISRERAGQLIIAVAAESEGNPLSDKDARDVLTILRWYQERNDEATVPDADERAFKLIGDAASYLMPKQQEKVNEGLYHLRSRLTEYDALKAEVERLRACPACGGSGQEPIGEHFVTAEMAYDAGQPELAGESMGIEYGPCPECLGHGYSHIGEVVARAEKAEAKPRNGRKPPKMRASGGRP